MESEAMEKEETPRSSKPSRLSRQFWQAGEFLPEADAATLQRNQQPGLDHARLHPRFLHSNATSHKWALGALVELLDNSMDEVTAGCTYVNVDKVNHPMDGAHNPMLLVEDNGGGMDPATIRNCMSFGFSLKHGKKMIGQYGNGFKTSTMRLGADALVLTKSTEAQSCSVGLLSYTFLTETNSQDVVVPIIDYSLHERTRCTRGDENEWKSKLDMICEWGPFGSEAEIWKQLDSMPSQGTRVYIWNLWQTSDNLPELDFISDVHDVRLRGHEEDLPESSGRKKKADEGMKRCHSYRHSLRSYVSMLYLQWPENFQIVVRGKQVVPVPVTAGMKHVAVYDYRPRSIPKDESSNTDKGPIVVPVYIGFAVEAPDTSVSGFCVYHRNRLIKPFWKVYTSASSVGRGVIGFLQVDFVEPAHDKQDFENTPPLQKLEKYLKRQVPHFWRTKSHLVGYQDHVTPAKNDPPLEEPATAEKPSIETPRRNGTFEEIPVSVTVECPQPTADKTQPSRPSSYSLQSGGTMTVESRSAPALKTPSKCLHEMQQHISQLQQSVQEFCNTYEIKEDAQLVLGRIFGTTMTKVLDTARDLKKLCATQVKGHRQALLFVAKSKTDGKLQGNVPQFIQAEMKAMGLDLSQSMVSASIEETNGQPRLQRKITEENGQTQPGTPDTVDDATPEKPRMEERSMEPTPQQPIDGPDSRWIQKAPSHESVQQDLDGINSESTNQDLAQLGLSVVEKILKTTPSKLGVVQLAPNTREILKRPFVPSSEPLEVVNLSDEVVVIDPAPKRQKTTDPVMTPKEAEEKPNEQTNDPSPAE